MRKLRWLNALFLMIVAAIFALTIYNHVVDRRQREQLQKLDQEIQSLRGR